MVRDRLRNRFVDDVRGEIKRVALEQLAAGGPAAVSVNAIGRELDVSGPALYRYFDGRDDLLTALIVDAYDDLANTTALAVATRRTPHTRVIAFADAYRQWANDQPHRYRLLFRAPLPGYDPNSAELVRASQAAMNVLLDALDGRPARHAIRDDVGVRAWLQSRGRSADLAPAAYRALTVWSRLHGLVSIEIEGGFASMGLDPRPLCAHEVDDRSR